MAKPDVEVQLRLDSATVADRAPGIPGWAYEFHRHVFLKLDVSGLSDMYEEGGRKPISPRFLAGMVILQYMHNASDRQAVQYTLIRRDWRVALGIPGDYEGFCPTVLVRFRQRLREAGLEKALLGQVIEIARGLGMLKDRHRLRADATELLANVSRLTQGDLIRETMRVALRELGAGWPEVEADEEFRRLYDLYGEESWLGQPASKEKLTRLGRDGYALLRLCGKREFAGAKTLSRVLSENFIVAEGDLRALEPSEMSSGRIRTPHEPDALLGKKRSKEWVGDKVHVIETAEEGANLVVGVIVTDPRVEDSTVTDEVLEVGLAQVPEAEELLADTGYASLANSIRAEAAGVTLVSPPRQNTCKTVYPASEFEIDFKAETARCPRGHESSSWSNCSDGRVYIRWSASICGTCPSRAECTTSKEGRQLNLARDWDRLERERAWAQGSEFWEEYRHRAAVEATISELVWRHGFRRSRYRGASGRRLHAFLSVIALNVKRLIRWALEGWGHRGAGRQPADCGACV